MTPADPLQSKAPIDWNRLFYLLWVLLTLWRVLFIAIVPLELSADESYYWDWSRQLDWGYYSKPPLIAWINALSTGLLGSTEFSVRLPAALLSSGALGLIFLLARRMFDARIGFWAAAASATAPGSCAAAFIMTIDAPLVFFWSLALYALWRILASDRSEPGWELVYILACGLGILAKQMMMVFPVLTLLFLLVSRPDRQRLKGLRIYPMMLLPQLFLAPTLWWNYRNQWITIEHTGHHFEGHGWTVINALASFGEFVATQLFVGSPIIAVLFLVVAGCFLIQFRQTGRRVRYLLLFSAIPLVVFILMSFRQRINPNWPAVFYLAGIILPAAWACGAVDCRNRLAGWRKWYLPGVLLGAVMVVLTYGMTFALPLLNLDGSKLDPVIRLRGWQDLTSQVETIRDQLPDKTNTLIVSTRRQPASALAFYLPDQPRVYQMPVSSQRIRSQYDLWGGLENETGADVLIVARQGDALDAAFMQSFDAVKKLATLTTYRGKNNRRLYDIYLGRNLSYEPQK